MMQPKPIGLQVRQFVKERLQQKLEELEEAKKGTYVPTGLQEDIIYAVGCGKFQIVVALDANRTGKSRTIMEIAKNIIWPCDPEWFAWWEGQSIFKKWPYPEKCFRITGTPTAVADNGSIFTELKKAWPRGRYSLDKNGKNYYSQITTDTGWIGDVMTYEQSREEYEGKTISLIISDEPPKPALFGAFASRLMQGMWILGMTPINCGIFLDILDDVEDKGALVARVSGTIWQNDKDVGKPNHKGTKRGLWTRYEIDNYVATIPPDERPARCEGLASNKSGKVYPMYDSTVHVRSVPLTGNYLASCNCYMAIDPSPKYYPFIKWYALTPSNEVFLYNEFPSRKYMGGLYFDEIRHNRQFKLSMEQLAAIIKACDLPQCGAKVIARIPDPRFAAQYPEYLSELARWGVTNWRIPPAERIETQRIKLQQLMTYDPQMPFNEHNCPKWYVCKWCENSDRGYNRHFWAEMKVGAANKDGIEAEDFKDGIDCDRYLLAAVDLQYKNIIEETAARKRAQSNPLKQSYTGPLVSTSMVG